MLRLRGLALDTLAKFGRLTSRKRKPFDWSQNNYVSGVFLLGRVFDKLVFSALTVIYYWKVGRDFSAVNVPNIAGVLFLWCAIAALC